MPDPEKWGMDPELCSAIYYHDDKYDLGSSMEELLKDADVIHHCFNDVSKAVKEKEKARYESLRKELGLYDGRKWIM